MQKDVPAHASQGWTVAWLDRASRFLWELKCGKREESLCRQAANQVETVIGQTDDLRLCPDGERR
ncbi:MAG: hypothetical protein GY801_01205 [bacterium]|nr:hypothetical protein [bacterium]